MELTIIGNVQTILNGNVSKNTLFPISISQLPYALGGAVIPDGKLSLGETIIYESVGHIFTIDQIWEEHRQLSTPFLMGIEKKPKESFSIDKKQSIQDLYEALIKEYFLGFAIIGTAMFSKLSVAYLKLSPIYGENVNELHDKYWAKERLTNCEAKLFGVVLNQPDPKAFYSNPNEPSQQTLASHTHVLAPNARHLLTDSEIVSANFWIEEIDGFKHIYN